MSRADLPLQPDSGAVIVPNYGIHWNQGVAWLQEGRGGYNALGLRDKSPFFVQTASGRRHCNHQFPMTAPVVSEFAWALFLELATDPVVQAMLPTPKPAGDVGAYFIEDPDGRYTPLLATLAHMSAPIYPVVTFGFKMKLNEASEYLAETNVQPLVYAQIPVEKSMLLHQLVQMAATSPRKLIVTGGADIPVPKAFKRIQPRELLAHDFLEIAQLPWVAIGATVLRKFMRGNGEWPPPLKDGRYEYVSPGATPRTPRP